jgi:hypothetical protein
MSITTKALARRLKASRHGDKLYYSEYELGHAFGRCGKLDAQAVRRLRAFVAQHGAVLSYCEFSREPHVLEKPLRNGSLSC